MRILVAILHLISRRVFMRSFQMQTRSQRLIPAFLPNEGVTSSASFMRSFQMQTIQFMPISEPTRNYIRGSSLQLTGDADALSDASFMRYSKCRSVPHSCRFASPFQLLNFKAKEQLH
jgi:hypothetical protein